MLTENNKGCLPYGTAPINVCLFLFKYLTGSSFVIPRPLKNAVTLAQTRIIAAVITSQTGDAENDGRHVCHERSSCNGKLLFLPLKLHYFFTIFH